jgi:hypothetical protein
MFSRLFSAFRKFIISVERDRFDAKFEIVDQKFDHFDQRIDDLEKHQVAQTEKLSAIHQVTLANNEVLEEKLNRQTVTTEGVRQIVDARIGGFQETIKTLQGLIQRILDRDCGTN